MPHKIQKKKEKTFQMRSYDRNSKLEENKILQKTFHDCGVKYYFLGDLTEETRLLLKNYIRFQMYIF